MLTAEGCAARRERLWDALPSPCDALVLGDPSSLIYFANYVQSPFTFRSNDAGALLILRPDRATLVGDDMVRPFLDRAHVDEVVAPTWYDGKHSAPPRRGQLARTAREALGRVGARGAFGVELSSVPMAVLGDAARSPVDLEPIVRELRRAKDADELELIRRSIRAGEAGFAAALDQIRPGMTEFEAFLLVQRASLEQAGDRAIVYGDFDSGPRAEQTIGPPTERVMKAGDLFILDFSVVLDGYRGDFANTIAVGGQPSARQRALYEGCVAAMAAGEARLRAGAAARDVDTAVRRAFAERGLDADFPTHSGHGIGLGHPEPPYIVPDSADTLRAGDVVTLEPGQYGPDFGGLRYERNYLITAEGFETLTHHQIALTK